MEESEAPEEYRIHERRNMEKAIYTMNMPKSCTECRMCVGGISCYVNRTIALSSSDREKCRPEWCPLKPLPEKKTVRPEDSTGAVAVKYGWNNCIDEILREKNDR